MERRVRLRTSQSSKRPKRLKYQFSAFSGAFDRICWEYENAAIVTRGYVPSRGAMARGVFRVLPGFRSCTFQHVARSVFSDEWLSFSTFFLSPLPPRPPRTPESPLACRGLQFCSAVQADDPDFWLTREVIVNPRTLSGARVPCQCAGEFKFVLHRPHAQETRAPAGAELV